MMIEGKRLQTLKRHLFTEQCGTVFTILDGASVPDLPQNLASFDPDYVSLYRGELEPDMAEVVPYLVILHHDAPFTEWVLANGWGKHWGIFGSAQANLPMLRKHFRQFVIVYDESGRSLYLRYYDPRVLLAYLPTCNGREVKSLMGPVSFFLAEENEEKLKVFRMVGENLSSHEVCLDAS